MTSSRLGSHSKRIINSSLNVFYFVSCKYPNLFMPVGMSLVRLDIIFIEISKIQNIAFSMHLEFVSFITLLRNFSWMPDILSYIHMNTSSISGGICISVFMVEQSQQTCYRFNHLLHIINYLLQSICQPTCAHPRLEFVYECSPEASSTLRGHIRQSSRETIRKIQSTIIYQIRIVLGCQGSNKNTPPTRGTLFLSFLFNFNNFLSSPGMKNIFSDLTCSPGT